MSYPRKRLQTTHSDIRYDDDFISNLPDSLISDILSRLPTKCAVRTSVLSRNWKYKWTSIYDIDMADNAAKSFLGYNGIVNFADVVTRLLLRTRSSRLRSFRVSCVRECYFGYYETWISDVLMRSVQYLDIIARNISKRLDCFSGWNLVTGLKLEISCTLKVPTNKCFPNLKWLLLVGGGGGGARIKLMTTNVCDDTGRVALFFPVLEILHLSCCEWLDVKYVEIQAPELISVFIFGSYSVMNPELEICGPKLAMFELCGVWTENIVLSAPAVTYMALASTRGVILRNLLNKRLNLKFLKLNGGVLKALLHMKPRLDFTNLDQLKELEVNLFCNIKDMMELLQVFPPLKSLIINLCSLKNYEFEKTSTRKILSQLKEVKLVNFGGGKGQYDLAKYLLENAENLEEMSVNLKEMSLCVSKLIDKMEMVGQSLSKLKPKGSRCKLVVEQKQAGTWFGPAPRVIVNKDGNQTRVVYPHRFWM